MFDTNWKNEITDRLAAINTADGYENDVCFIEGYMTLYARDLHQRKNGFFFPAISAHSDEEEIVMQPRGSKQDKFTSQNVRSFSIDVALDVVPRETLTARFESLLRDVKKTIATVNTRNVTLTRVKFNEPEEENYAFMVISGEIKYNETWN